MALVLMPFNLKHSSSAITPLITHQWHKKMLLQCTFCLYCNWKHRYLMTKSICSGWSLTHRFSFLKYDRSCSFITVTLSFTCSAITVSIFMTERVVWVPRQWFMKEEVHSALSQHPIMALSTLWEKAKRLHTKWNLTPYVAYLSVSDFHRDGEKCKTKPGSNH